MTSKSQKEQVDQISISQVADQSNDDNTLNTDSKVETFKKWADKMFGDIYAEDDPKQLTTSKKYLYVFVVALLGINATITILIYQPGIYEMADELHTSVTGIDATMAIYIAFTGISVNCHSPPASNHD